MELMSSLLFCALVGYLPHTLGYYAVKHFPLQVDNEVNFNDTVMFHQKPKLKRPNVGPPLMTTVAELLNIFKDVQCKRCTVCMETAMKAYKYQTHILKHRSMPKNLITDVLKNEYGIIARIKRDTKSGEKKSSGHKRKRRNKKQNKSITVTKYYGVDHDVRAIKLKESIPRNNATDNDIQTCTIYGITESYDCFTPDANTFIQSVKKKKSRSVPVTETTTETTGFSLPYYKKRLVDTVQTTNEDFASSIEEIF